MKIGIIGAGRIGGNIATQAIRGGHEVAVSFSRDPAGLRAFAGQLGGQASAATPAEAASWADLVVFSVPWPVIPAALGEAGPLDGTIVVDTTNQFGSGPMPAAGQTAAAFNAARMPGARYTKSFNTLTAGFQAEAASRSGGDRAVQWLCGDDSGAKDAVARFIESTGYVPVDLGGTAGCAVMEAPRRAGAVYGEEYRLADARAVAEAVRAGRPIPPAPRYG
jgi:hypothetical protein